MNAGILIKTKSGHGKSKTFADLLDHALSTQAFITIHEGLFY